MVKAKILKIIGLALLFPIFFNSSDFHKKTAIMLAKQGFGVISLCYDYNHKLNFDL